jgi:hypothetical protein
MILNPTSQTVTADIVILGIDPAVAPLAPTSVSIPPGEVVLFDTSTIAGLPDGPHGAVVTSRSGESIVVERILTRPIDGTFATTAVIGAQRGFLSSRWRVSVGPSLAIDAAIVVLNAAGGPSVVRVLVLGPGGEVEVQVEGLTNLELAPNGILRLDITDPDLIGRPLEIESDQPILVERRLERNASLRGRTGSLAIPE